jgi:hypothetical protein
MKDFYYILGVDHDAALAEIKEAYRKLSKKFHPDLNDGNKYFETHFREIQEAYETLSEPYKRDQYDKALANAGPGFSTAYNQQAGFRPQGATYQTKRTTYYSGRRRGPGLGMSVILILIAVIIGVYLVKYINNSKSQQAKKITAAEAPTIAVHHFHKKRHGLKAKFPVDIPELKPHKTIVAAIKTVPVTTQVKTLPVIKPVAPSTVEKPAQVIPVNNADKAPAGTYLYATYVQPNATGIINMRKNDAFNSDIITTIPADAKVFVLEKDGSYYKVRYDNYTGYVPKWALEIK